tara:strand:+ start:569 stop:727 length:159 start_codon:yes stop_codon:yes gene_type:complete
MEIVPGQLIRYKSTPECVGIVLEVGETMAKVRWHDENIVEWMPFYSLELIDV